MHRHCISSSCVGKIMFLTLNNSGKKGLNDFRGFSPWLLGCRLGQNIMGAGTKEKIEKHKRGVDEREPANTVQVGSDLLPTNSPYLVFFTTCHSCIVLYIHQRISPLIRSEPSKSNLFKITSSGNQVPKLRAYEKYFAFTL